MSTLTVVKLVLADDSNEAKNRKHIVREAHYAGADGSPILEEHFAWRTAHEGQTLVDAWYKKQMTLGEAVSQWLAKLEDIGASKNLKDGIRRITIFVSDENYFATLLRAFSDLATLGCYVFPLHWKANGELAEISPCFQIGGRVWNGYKAWTPDAFMPRCAKVVQIKAA